MVDTSQVPALLEAGDRPCKPKDCDSSFTEFLRILQSSDPQYDPQVRDLSCVLCPEPMCELNESPCVLPMTPKSDSPETHSMSIQQADVCNAYQHEHIGIVERQIRDMKERARAILAMQVQESDNVEYAITPIDAFLKIHGQRNPYDL